MKMSSIQLLFVLIALAHGLVPDSAHPHLGSLRYTHFSQDRELTFRLPSGQKSFLQANSTRPFKRMPTVLHVKAANGTYKKGSDYDPNAQEGMEEVATDHATVAALPAETASAGESGRVAVYGMGATVVLLSLIFAMTNSGNRLVSNFTWGTLDNVICIFLAVLVYQAIDEVVYDAGLIPKRHFVLGSFIYAMILMLVAVGLSFALKGTPSNLAIFVASSSHFVAFGYMHAATLGFEHHTSRVWHAVVIFLAVLCIIGSVYFLGYQTRKAMGMLADSRLMEMVDDLENDAGAMAASMSWTILMCYLMTSEFQDIIDTEAVARAERSYMLCYAIVISVVGALLIVFISGLEHSASYVKKRLGMFCSASLAMCAAWAWLLWGKWRFHQSAALESAPMFSRIAFATCASLVAMAVILVLAYLPGQSPDFKKDKALALLTVSLVVGWAWEETFDAGLEVLAEGQDSEHRALYKIVAAVGLIAIVLPVHVIYFKPILANLPKDDSKK